MIDLLKSPQAIAAMVAAAVTLLTFFAKNIFEKKYYSIKLNLDHKFEQKKEVKKILAKYKARLMTACEDLNLRLWNFGKPDHYKWLRVGGIFDNKQHYYFHSFIYRILSVYAWKHKIETELTHLDTTIADKKDLEFIKFLKFYGRIFSDTDFFKGFDFDIDNQKDHIFKNILDGLHEAISTDTGIITYDEYLNKLNLLKKTKLKTLFNILDGVCMDEERLRWNWFQILKVLNIAFLNSYGYDYQKTPEKKLKIAIETPCRSKLNANFIFLLKEHKLNKQRHICKAIKIMNETYYR